MIDMAEAEQYVAENRAHVERLLAEFALTDVLLFWSNKPEIKALQQKQWLPVLEWLHDKWQLTALTTESLTPPDNTVLKAKFFAYLQTVANKNLTAIYLAATNMKSPLLALVLVGGQIDAETAFAAAYLEELYQNLQWGEDEAAVNSREKVRADLRQIADYVRKA